MAFSLSGLSGVGKGYQEGETAGTENQLRRQQMLQAQNDQMGQAAWGKALQLMMGGQQVVGGGAPGGANQQGPGGPPRPPADIPGAGGGASPQGSASQPYYGDVTLGSTPPEGGPGGPTNLMNPSAMASQTPPQFGQTAPGGPPRPAPQVPGMMNPQPMMPQPGQAGGGAPPVPPGGGGAPPGPVSGGPPGGAPGGMPGGAPGGPQGGRQQQGPLTLENVIQAIVKANPGAPPQVIAAGVKWALPMMTAQAQMQWREVSLALREQALNQAQQRIQQTGERDADRRNYQGNVIDLRTRSANRLEGAQTFKENLQTQTQQRLGAESASRIESRTKRDALSEQREQRQAAESKVRQEYLKANLDLKQQQALTAKLRADNEMKKLERQAQEAIDKKDFATARLRLQAMHLQSQEVISQWALGINTDSKTKKQILSNVLEENRLKYKEMIDNIGKPQAPAQQAPAQQGGTPKFNPATGKVEDQPGGQ